VGWCSGCPTFSNFRKFNTLITLILLCFQRQKENFSFFSCARSPSLRLDGDGDISRCVHQIEGSCSIVVVSGRRDRDRDHLSFFCGDGQDIRTREGNAKSIEDSMRVLPILSIVILPGSLMVGLERYSRHMNSKSLRHISKRSYPDSTMRNHIAQLLKVEPKVITRWYTRTLFTSFSQA